MISDQIHNLQNSSFCINLIFRNPPNLIIESGVHPSLHPKCHHQVKFGKLIVKPGYPPLCKRLIWDYKMPILHQLIVQLTFLTGVIHSKVKLVMNK